MTPSEQLLMSASYFHLFYSTIVKSATNNMSVRNIVILNVLIVIVGMIFTQEKEWYDILRLTSN